MENFSPISRKAIEVFKETQPWLNWNLPWDFKVTTKFGTSSWLVPPSIEVEATIFNHTISDVFDYEWIKSMTKKECMWS